MRKVVSVVMSNATREFDKEYDYLVPAEWEASPQPGMRVIVPFGRSNKPLEAFAVRCKEKEDVQGLKEIKQVLDENPVLFPAMLDLAFWMKERYICTYSDAIRCMLPPGIGVKSTSTVRLLDDKPEGLSPVQKNIVEVLRDSGNECEREELKARVPSKSFVKNLNLLKERGILDIYEEYTRRVNDKTVRVAYLDMPADEVSEALENNRIRKIQQIRVLEMLMENETISVPDITRFAGVSAGVLDTLKKYGYIGFRDVVVSRDPMQHRSFERTFPMQPTQEQSLVIGTVKERMDQGRFGEILLHGVTGSGKTEVYLQLIQYCLDKGNQAIVLVPEIALTPQMVERFKGRFGPDVAVLHSRLSMGERADQWKAIKEGKIKVAVGARSAVYAPFLKLGLIIIDEEHENTYKSEVTPKYHAAEVAREILKKSGGILMLGSATPSVETYFRAEQGEILRLEMRERANNACLPAVETVDLRKELDEGNRSIFSRRLAEEMEGNFQTKQQTILFLNRRGYASFVLCRSCGYTLRCPNCNISLTYHAHDDRLICHYCGFTQRNPTQCPRCKSNYIRHFGTGTQKVEEEIHKQFPASSVLRMDMDTTTGKNAHEEILQAFREKGVDILVGTQMIAKGHDFPKVTLVGVLAADSLLNLEDYRASERTFQLVSQVAGRAGRGALAGRVIVQTYNTEDFSIRAACSHNYSDFYHQEIKIRETLHYPPFTQIGVVLVTGFQDRSAFFWAKRAGEILKAFPGLGEEVEILGPARAPVSRMKSKYRWRIVIKCKEMDRMKDMLTSLRDQFQKQKGKTPVELSMDINPVSML